MKQGHRVNNGPETHINSNGTSHWDNKRQGLESKNQSGTNSQQLRTIRIKTNQNTAVETR